MNRLPYWTLEVVVALLLFPILAVALLAVIIGLLGEAVMDFSSTVIERVEKVTRREVGRS